MRVTDNVWVVTGAGQGMGLELALELLRRGAGVAAVDRDAAALEETVARAGDGARLSTHVVDVTERSAVFDLPAAVLEAHGRVDGLVNNAGVIQPFVPLLDLTDADISRVLEINLMGTVHMVRAFLPHLVARTEAHVANVSSMGGFFPFPGQTMYGASKAAVKLLTEGLYAELLDTPVHVSVIMPGAVATHIAENSGLAAPTAGDAKVPMTPADRAARIMLDGIEADRLHIYVGRDAKLMSLAVKVAPRRAIRLVQRRMRSLIS